MCFKFRLLAMVAISGSALLCQPARAQGIFDLFGGHSDHGGWGGSHHQHDGAGHRVDDSGHHINNHGNHSGADVFDGDHSNEHYYNSRPVYSATPRTTYYAPNVISSATPNQLPRPALPSFNPGEPIEIKYPGADGTVNYQLNDYKYAIGGGQSQLVPSDRAWVIAFDRGGNFGMAKYSLSPGIYHFTVTDKGWELQKQRAPQAQLAAAPAPPAPAPPQSVIIAPALPVTPAAASNALPVSPAN